MLNKFFRKISGNEGMTLIEVLLSLVILSIVLLSFVTFFIQSAKTSQQSSNILDATYIAQTYMEKFYQASTKQPYDAALNEMITEEAFQKKSSSGEYIELSKADGNFSTVAKLGRPQNGVSSIVIKIYNDAKQSRLEAQMETRLAWKK
ncbi:type IV pilus modification PilV family protein [Pseudogracilibacillus auburnensis]|uniref:type IV pilus modification PilV family protein n=1 Tax=Pseudogracilibacillus auburnensis TaxID=1494959 RepID=UPI001A978DD6|nr:prepilin-type N-terminal cleavage/methylation domain-containing protein [Pseudogracilibacillus auburnensis]MBO1004019.1 prepilin-type N-terminal cleavage/methylation domain-containing protein [Pseudogracilibacillus auburnensis]